MFRKHSMFLFTLASHTLPKDKDGIGLRAKDLVWCYWKREEAAGGGT